MGCVWGEGARPEDYAACLRNFICYSVIYLSVNDKADLCVRWNSDRAWCLVLGIGSMRGGPWS